MAMLQDILAKNPQRPVTFLHVARSTENFALMNEVRQCMPKLTNGKCGVYLTQAKEGDGKCTCFKFRRGRRRRPGADCRRRRVHLRPGGLHEVHEPGLCRRGRTRRADSYRSVRHGQSELNTEQSGAPKRIDR